MTLYLKRNERSENGIFSILTADQGNILFHTAEHAYDSEPKIYNGVFICKLGDFPKHGRTFEVTGVEGHTSILFHVGNYPQKDSEGCILIGKNRVGNMITESKTAFNDFMKFLSGLDQFELVVE